MITEILFSNPDALNPQEILYITNKIHSNAKSPMKVLFEMLLVKKKNLH